MVPKSYSNTVYQPSFKALDVKSDKLCPEYSKMRGGQEQDLIDFAKRERNISKERRPYIPHTPSVPGFVRLDRVMPRGIVPSKLPSFMQRGNFSRLYVQNYSQEVYKAGEHQQRLQYPSIERSIEQSNYYHESSYSYDSVSDIIEKG